VPLAKFVRLHELEERSVASFAKLRFAVMIARSPDGAVLVFNRYRQLWELPGGFIDAGESPRVSAERELLEEAGCLARNTRWLGIVEVDDGASHYGAVYGCDADTVNAKFRSSETDGVHCWQRDRQPQPLGHSDAALLERFG
jgi:8-oxo-dGTP diphosphatase